MLVNGILMLLKHFVITLKQISFLTVVSFLKGITGSMHPKYVDDTL